MKVKQKISNNLLITKYLTKYEPVYVIGTIILGVLSHLLAVAANVILVKYIIDAVISKKSISSIVFAIGLFTTYVITVEISSCLFNEIYAPKAKERLNFKMQSEIYEKAIKIDLICYDNPKFYDDFVWAVSEVESRGEKTLGLLRQFFGQIAIITSIVVIFSFTDLTLIILVGVCILISFIFDSLLVKKAYNREMDLKPQYRKRDYVRRIFYLPDYSKEIRLNKASNKFKEMFNCTNKKIDESIDKHDKKIWKLDFLQNFIPSDLAVRFLLILYLGYKVIVLKTITFGEFVALYNGVDIAISSIYNLLGKTIVGLHEQGLYTERFKKFMEYENKVKDGNKSIEKIDFAQPIELKNLSFTYGDEDEKVLKNINMTIELNEKVAIVGYNGAGKTTLVKLLTRLYDPSEGEILLGGVNIKDYSLKEYREGYAAVFQDYQLFSAKLSENVLMDNVKEEEKEKVISALSESDFSTKLNLLEDGIDTSILREFDDMGVILSGGEGQKVAIARAIVKNSKVVILDEPSSALDPISEYNINNTLLKVAEDKTVIFISHRLTTTRMVDKIYVFENGEIIEVGNHEELIKLGGTYAKMFNLQAERYKMIV